MSNELILYRTDAKCHVKRALHAIALAADSVVKYSLITGVEGGHERRSTCKEFLQVQNVLKRGGKK